MHDTNGYVVALRSYACMHQYIYISFTIVSFTFYGSIILYICG
jgi:hypothetical protein